MPRASQTPPLFVNERDLQPPSRIFAGTSGWAYPTWKPDFYPATTPQKKFLDYYSSQLTSVEVNYTFRALPTVKTLENWLASTPSSFRFSFKSPQRITHFKRLRECAADVAQFISVLEPVRQAGKLGLLLFQLPPNFKADAALLADFLSIAALENSGATPIAFEFRHESWFSDATYAILREHNAALCIAESDELRTPEVHTAATHTSFRLRRTGGYSAAELAAFAERFSTLARERDVYVYFKHEDEPSGAIDALKFLTKVREASGA
ncbi:hypothetical protein GCM10011507_26020 [Edaphobacter acidisoli]|uniref:DUF72 domain-containing protein n=1 Tax=Edaphobacter acidisoli TaxID=2040573 RepID=A0A916W797_9BACT|nr:DUF72 domain-containing protein [Edaphobacter acidisoli]GGA73201.1 hypothetical protein GCM10011507_26020 [Edaphobacter acidisoli]